MKPVAALPNYGDESMPPFGKWGWTLRAAYGGAVLFPYYGLSGQAIRHLGELLHAGRMFQLAHVLPVTVGLVGAVHLLARGRRLWVPQRSITTAPRRKVIPICGMEFEEKHLYNNILILGGIGSGKTSAALDPTTAQLLSIFNDPGEELGGFFLDVKGNRTTRVLKFAHDAGRDVTKSCKVIRPNCSLPYVKLKEEGTKRMFFVPAVQFSTGSEAGRLLAGMSDPDTGEPIPANLFSWAFHQIEAWEPKLKKIVFDPTVCDIRFCGWRRQGNELVRVNHTDGPWQSVEFKIVGGRQQRVPYPRRLRYAGVGYIDNGLHYNIVNNNLDPAEAARRLRLIAQLLNNGKTGGDNKFWDDGAENHVTYCIEFLKLTNPPDAQVDGPDIARLTTQKAFFSEREKDLKRMIEELKKRILENKEPEIKGELEGRLKKYTDILSYFNEEWNVMEGKTKTIMQQVVKQLFNAFLLDAKLQKSFGTKATYSFITAITRGDLFIFGGCEYETLAKMIGTALKMDFQSCALARPANRHLNQKRPLLFENDECQEFAVAGTGSGVGDDRTMSLSRESKLINLLATQTMAVLGAVMGNDRSRVYVAACGGIISFHISDPDTAQFISKLIPEVVREKRRLTSSDTRVTQLLSADTKLREQIDFKREARFHPSDFASLNLEHWEAIAYNKAQVGDQAKAVRQNNEPHPIGSPAGSLELEEFMRWYEIASVEELAWNANKGTMFDPLPAMRAAGIPPAESKPAGQTPEPAPFVPEALPRVVINASITAEQKQRLKDASDRATSGPPKVTSTPVAKEIPPRKEAAAAPASPIQTPLPKRAETPSIPPDPPEENRVTGETLNEIRTLYRDPAVLAELASNLTAGLDLGLDVNYQELLEQASGGTDPVERSIEHGPRGLDAGNPTARAASIREEAPPVDPLAETRQRSALKQRMAELDRLQATVASAPAGDVTSDEMAELAAAPAPDPAVVARIKNELF